MGNSPLFASPTSISELLVRKSTAPVIAVTYSSAEFAKFHPDVPWQLTIRAIAAAGAAPLAIDCATPQPRIADLIRLSDGLLVLGGGDVDPTLYGGDESDPLVAGTDPVRDQNELEALSVARELDRPILAICRGFQLLNVAYGGRLVADLTRDRAGSVEHGPGMPALMSTQHAVNIDASSKLASWISYESRIAVNSEHHQGILSVGDGLRATAHSDDGLVEAVESIDGCAVGIQWHPEFLWHANEHASLLLGGFVEVCRASAESRAHEIP